MTYLLDTNAVSEFGKRSIHPEVERWRDSVEEHELYLSVLVVGEIRQGVERLRRRDPVQSRRYERWLSRLQTQFVDRTLPVTREIAIEWGKVSAARPLPVVDALLAATALVHDFTLVTRNTKDVSGTGVRVVNPFEPAR